MRYMAVKDNGQKPLQSHALSNKLNTFVCEAKSVNLTPGAFNGENTVFTTTRNISPKVIRLM